MGLTLAVYSALSVATSWPLALHPLSLQVSRQFDIYVTSWLAATDPRLALWAPGLQSAWPLGEALSRADSFVFMLIAWALSPIGGAWLAVALVTLVGPVVSAWAAERFAARCLDARFPWSLVAGAVFGFGGAAATTLLEGHVYLLLDPWLPLCATAAWRATEDDARPADGLLAALWWSLCLWTSAYLGLGATLLVGALALRGRLRPAVAGPFAALALASGAAYVALFRTGADAVRIGSALAGTSARGVIEAGSATLGTLLGWSPWVDASGHSIAPAVGGGVLVLALVAPILGAERRAWAPLVGLAAAACALALGPVLRSWPQGPGLPWLLSLLDWTGAGSFLHFPWRFMAVASLALGALAARAVSDLAARRPRLAPALLGFVAVDLLLSTGTPLRTGRVPVAVPSAYAAAPAEGAVLELLPRYAGMAVDLEIHWNNLTCSYQAAHRRPVTNRCLGTRLYSGPRVRIGEWVTDAALRGADPAAVREGLAALGVGAVAVHPDLLAPTERDALVAGLEEILGPPVARSTDAGDAVTLFAVSAPSTDATARRARYRSMFEEGGE